MKTLTPVAAWTALTNLMPEDARMGVRDLRTARVLEYLFQAIVNRLEFIRSYAIAAPTVVATLGDLPTADASNHLVQYAIFPGDGSAPETLVRNVREADGTYAWTPST